MSDADDSNSIPDSAAPSRSLPRWRWWAHVAILGAYPLALGLMGSMAASGGATGPVLPESVAGLLTLAAVELGIFACVFGAAWFSSRASFDQLYLRWRGGVWPIPRGCAYSIVLRLALALVIIALLIGAVIVYGAGDETVQRFRPRVEAVVSPTTLEQNPVYLLLTLTLISFVVAGLREELWRAGMLAGLKEAAPEAFKGWKGQLLAVGIIAVIFGLGHTPQGWAGVLLTTILGLALGGIIIFHNSIWDAVIAHGFFNATTFVLLAWLSRAFPDVLGG